MRPFRYARDYSSAIDQVINLVNTAPLDVLVARRRDVRRALPQHIDGVVQSSVPGYSFGHVARSRYESRRLVARTAYIMASRS